MGVSLTEEALKLYTDARLFSVNHLAPMVKLVENGVQSVSDIFELFAQQGYLGLLIPKELGGKGYTFLETALIYEGIAFGSGTLAFMLQLHNNITYEIAMLYNISDEVKLLLPDMIRGKSLTAFAFTEEKSGSDAASIETYADLKSDGYHIYGKKTWIANSGDAKHFNVIVRDGKNAKKMLMLLVDRGTPGFRISESKRRFGGNAISCCDLNFENCVVPESRRISSNGFKDALQAIDIARIFVPAMAIGLASSAMNQTIRYLSARESFGKPIIERQGIQWTLATLKTRVEASKWLVYHTATLKDENQLTNIDAAMNKLLTTDVAMDVSLQCMHYQGANGFAENSSISRTVAEAKMFQIIDGTSEIQKLIIGKYLDFYDFNQREGQVN